MMISIKGAEIDILAVVALIVSAFSAIWAWRAVSIARMLMADYIHEFYESL